MLVYALSFCGRSDGAGRRRRRLSPAADQGRDQGRHICAPSTAMIRALHPTDGAGFAHRHVRLKRRAKFGDDTAQRQHVIVATAGRLLRRLEVGQDSAGRDQQYSTFVVMINPSRISPACAGLAQRSAGVMTGARSEEASHDHYRFAKSAGAGGLTLRVEKSSMPGIT